jgi:hypothetical protein
MNLVKEHWMYLWNNHNDIPSIQKKNLKQCKRYLHMSLWGSKVTAIVIWIRSQEARDPDDSFPIRLWIETQWDHWLGQIHFVNR